MVEGEGRVTVPYVLAVLNLPFVGLYKAALSGEMEPGLKKEIKRRPNLKIEDQYVFAYDWIVNG